MPDTRILVESALSAIADSSDEKSLDQLRVDFLGKKGSLTELLKGLGKLAPEERPAAGEKINLAKKSDPASAGYAPRRSRSRCFEQTIEP